MTKMKHLKEGVRMVTRSCPRIRKMQGRSQGGSPADTNDYDRFDAPIALNTREV